MANVEEQVVNEGSSGNDTKSALPKAQPLFHEKLPRMSKAERVQYLDSRIAEERAKLDADRKNPVNALLLARTIEHRLHYMDDDKSTRRKLAAEAYQMLDAVEDRIPAINGMTGSRMHREFLLLKMRFSTFGKHTPQATDLGKPEESNPDFAKLKQILISTPPPNTLPVAKEIFQALYHVHGFKERFGNTHDFDPQFNYVYRVITALETAPKKKKPQ